MKTYDTLTIVLLISGLLGPNSMFASELGITTELRAADWPGQHAKCRAVPLTKVQVRGYLGKRIDRNPASILLALESPIPKGFEAAVLGSKPPTYRLAADSDLYKWLEGACYVFARTEDQEIRKKIDRIAGLIVKCQDDDGYINTQPSKKRWDPGDQSRHSDHGHRPATARCMLPQINRTACCPSNMWRFFGALPEYLFSYDEDGLFVNLYTSSIVNHALADGRQIALSVETEYPHTGDVKVRFDGESPTPFKLRLRIPGWCKSAMAQWPGQQKKRVEGGSYLAIDRTWKNGDTVQLQFDMPVRMILPHPQVKANAGQVVFARGPVLFCLEKEDVDFPVEQARVAIRPEEVTQRVGVTWHPELLDGILMLHVPGLVDGKVVHLKLVPWSVRANRSDHSRWLIWLPRAGWTAGGDSVKAAHPYRQDSLDDD